MTNNANIRYTISYYDRITKSNHVAIIYARNSNEATMSFVNNYKKCTIKSVTTGYTF